MNFLECYINDQYHKVLIEAGLTTLKLIRDKLSLTGTKESCSEGDCGACTVVIGCFEDDVFTYKSVNSCIYPATKLNNCHLITIEGLSIEQELHPIQEFLLKRHGTQCGFCTPGIVMSIFALFSVSPNPSDEMILSFLEGNLCRCTGYLSILESAKDVREFYQTHPEEYLSFFPDYCIRVQNQLKKNTCKNDIYFSSDEVLREATHTYLLPKTLKEFFEHSQKYDNYKIINGGSDVMVEVNIKRQIPKVFIDISNIQALNQIYCTKCFLTIGAGVSYHKLFMHSQVQEVFPVFKEIISLIASEQVRNIATIGGNIANASPVADFATVLLGLNAELEIVGHQQKRNIYLDDFYLDYKKTALQKNEIIYQINIKKVSKFCSFEKSSKRKSVDISALVSFFNVTDYGIFIAFGGIAPYPVKISIDTLEFISAIDCETEQKKLINEIQQKFSPLSDVRGSKEYRNILIKNHLISHFEKYRSIQ